MSNDKLWKPEGLESDLSVLSDELDGMFLVERSLLSSTLSGRVMANLPLPEKSPLIRFARVLTAGVLLSALLFAGYLVTLLAQHGTALDTMTAFQVILGSVMALTGILICFAAPSLIRFDHAFMRKYLKGRWMLSAQTELVLLRVGAFLLVASSVFLMA